MAVEFEELPGWRFDADEVSAGVYKANGVDRQGRNVEAMGTDPDALIEKCRQSALQIMEAERGKN
jgi:hypothetical protein